MCEEHGQPTVPVLYHGIVLAKWLGDRTLQDASNGTSVLRTEQIREGIVIKPLREMWDDELGGRLILKQRSPVYLEKTDH